MKNYVWLSRPQNENQLKCAIKDFHEELEKPGPEFDMAKQSIDAFQKRLITVIEFDGKNCDSVKRRNFAWAKYQDVQPNFEAEETMDDVQIELVELTLVQDQFEFEPCIASTPTKRVIEVDSPKTPVLFRSQLQAKKQISRKRLFKNC